MTCEACQAHAANPRSGLYQAQCAKCGARLLASARGLRPAQSALLAAITRRKHSATRSEILAAMAQIKP